MRNKIKFIVSSGLAAGLLLAFANASASDASRKFDCSTQNGKQVCVLQTTVINKQVSSDTTTTTTTTTQKRLEDGRMKDRQERIQRIAGVYKAQIERAQKAIDRMQNIIDRIKAQRAKITTGSTADLAALDALITKADTQKQDVDKALTDVKTKADAIKGTLSTITTDTANSTDTASTNITKLKQQVKDFQTSVKDLKKKLNTLHGTLMETIKKMRTITKASKATDTNTNTSTTGEKENE